MKCPRCQTEIPKPEPRKDQETPDGSDKQPQDGPCPQCGWNVMGVE